MSEGLSAMLDALMQIGNLPLEFNTRARAIAQRCINNQGIGQVSWHVPLTDEQIWKVIDRGGIISLPQEENTVSTETKEAVTGTTGAENETPYQPPEIEMIPVESSNIIEVGHDGDETLRVRFKSGSYDYPGITETEFFDLVNAESVGKAYNSLTRARGIKGIKLS